MPEEHKKYIIEQGGSLEKLTFYYDRELDLIMMNEDSDTFEQYRGIISGMLELDEENTLLFYNKLPTNIKEEFKNLFTILLAVQKYRVLRGESENAKA